MEELIKKSEYKDWTPYYFKGVKCEGVLLKNKLKEGEKINLYPVWEVPFICEGKYLIAQLDQRTECLLEIAKQIKRCREKGVNLDWIKSLKGHIPDIASLEKDEETMRKQIEQGKSNF